MVMRMLLMAGASVILALCCGISCNIEFPGDGDGGGNPLPPSYVALNNANAVVKIEADADGDTAAVTAKITTLSGQNYALQNGQVVEVNNTALSGPNADDEYTATVSANSEYMVEANEPTRGVSSTTVAAPTDFAITSPTAGATASLSGFTLLWSNANVNLRYQVTLQQTILGQEKEKILGPFTNNTGVFNLTASDLSQFQQGANLNMTLTLITAQTDIEGFNAATGTVELSDTVAVAPGP